MKKEKKTLNLEDMVSKDFLEKMKARETPKEKTQYLLSREWAMLGELAFYTGYSAVQAFFDDIITIGQAQALLDGAKKVHSQHVYDQAIANLAVQPSKEKNHFTKLMKPYMDDIKGVE